MEGQTFDKPDYGLVDSSLQTIGLFSKVDETDTPAALANAINEFGPDIKE